jgi:hypothetical protein
MSTGTEVIGLQTQKLFRPDLHHRSGFTPSYGTVKWGNSVIWYQVRHAQGKTFAEATPHICNDINILYKIGS